jgi:hypothetical protein
MKKVKNKFIKYYIAVIYFCSTFVMFAEDPASNDENGTLENTDPLPIDDYVWVLAVLGLLFVFMKIRTIQKNRIQE